jgi:hypothetical protein
MTQISERKVQKTFETPYKVFTHSDKREENDKLTPNREGQRVIAKEKCQKSKKEMNNP